MGIVYWDLQKLVEDRKLATQAEAYNENKFNNMIEAFKNGIQQIWIYKGRKEYCLGNAKMGPKTERLDTFMRRIQELADDLGKDAEIFAMHL